MKSGIEPARLLEQLPPQTGRGLPPVERWNPEFSGELDIFIARNGQWCYQGNPMTRDAMVRLFSTILRRDEDGHYYLVTPVEKVRIRVERVPFVVVAMRVEEGEAGETLYLTTNVGDEFPLDADHPLWVEMDPESGEELPYVRVRGNLNALLARSVYYQMAERVTECEIDGRQRLGVRSGGCLFPLDIPA